MKKTCNGCKAQREGLSSQGGRYSCALGFKVENIYALDIAVNSKPLEDCPKPKNWNDYDILKFKHSKLVN